MAAEQRQRLQQLLKAPQATLRDPNICKAFCVNFCVHDLFEKTKQVPGPCIFDHNERLQRQYQQGKPIASFEHMFRAQLDRCLDDCDARIASAKAKIEPNKDDIDLAVVKKAQQVKEAEELVSVIRTEAEALLDIDLQKAFEQAKILETYTEDYNKSLQELDDLYYSTAPSGHQRLLICEVCGSTLSTHENDQHLGGHFQGKLHRGFVQVREACAKLSM